MQQLLLLLPAEPLVQRVRFPAGFGERCYDQARVRCLELRRPAQKLPLVPAQPSLERGHDDRVELQPLRLVDRRELDTQARIGLRRRVQPLERIGECCKIEHGAVACFRVREHLEEGLGFVEAARRLRRRGTSQRVPEALHRIAQPVSSQLDQRLLEQGPGVLEPRTRPVFERRASRGIAQQVDDGALRRIGRERMQVRKVEPAPGRPEHREPGRAVARVCKCAREREQVEHDRAFEQRIDVVGTKAESTPGELRDNVHEVAAALHEDRDRPRAGFGQPGGRDVGHFACLAHPVAPEECVHAHAALRRGVRTGGYGQIGDSTALHVVARGQDLRERAIEPLDHRGGGPEIDAEREAFEPEPAQTAVAHVEKEADLCVAEPVDRLHGIADQEQRPAITRLPAGRQRLEQPHLCVGGVLEFVDEHVPQARIEREGRIRGRLLVAKRRARRGGKSRVVRCAPLGEHELELRERKAQHGQQGMQYAPLSLVVSGGRQASRRVEVIRDRVVRRAARRRSTRPGLSPTARPVRRETRACG